MAPIKPTLTGYIAYSIAVSFLFYVMALQVSPSVMTQDLMRDYGVNAASIGILSSAFFYSYTAMQIPAGLLNDRFGLRSILASTLFICLLGTLLFSTTEYFSLAIIARFIMGMGSTFAFICTLTAAARYFPPQQFALLAGISQMVSGIGAIAGEAPISALIDAIGWRMSSLVFTAVGLALAIAAIIFIKETHNKKTKNKTELKKSLKEIFANKQTWWIAIYAFSGWTPVAVFAGLWGIPYLKHYYNIHSTTAAIYIAFVWLGLIIAGPTLGWLSDFIKRRVIILIISSAIGLVCSTLMLSIPNLSHFVMSLLLLGMGIASCGQIITFALVKDINKTEVTSTAVGVNNMAVVAGAALCQPLVGYLIQLKWDGRFTNDIPAYALLDFQFALTIIPACYLMGLIVSLFFIKETYCKPLHNAPI